MHHGRDCYRARRGRVDTGRAAGAACHPLYGRAARWVELGNSLAITPVSSRSPCAFCEGCPTTAAPRQWREQAAARAHCGRPHSQCCLFSVVGMRRDQRFSRGCYFYFFWCVFLFFLVLFFVTQNNTPDQCAFWFLDTGARCHGCHVSAAERDGSYACVG